MGTTLLLNAVTLGGYSTYQVGVSMWQGYHEGGIIGAINEVNPFYQIGKAGAQSYLAIAGGDYREGSSKAIVAAVLAAATVVGIIQGAGALAGKPPMAGSGIVATPTSEGSAAAIQRAPLKAGEAGSYGSLRTRSTPGDQLTPHHMPQAALGHTSREAGGALTLPHSEHIRTRTFGGRGISTAKAEAGLPFRDVLARDIRDIRQSFGPKYDQGLRDLLRYYKETHPQLIKR
ncbi:MAG: hypothetical protein HUU21_40905 [Polyangiaceae bacterium]|nr:hypothetical protein [Polyangiaceae bacterium]